MSADEAQAMRRWLAIVAARLAGFAGALFGLMLLARSEAFAPKLLGIAIVFSALVMLAIVPRSLARRWRTPPA